MSSIVKTWLTVNGAAEYTSCSKRTVLRWIHEGLPHAKLSARGIRIKVDDLEEWMNKFVNRDGDLNKQIDNARKAARKKLKALGIPCSLNSRRCS